MKIGRLIDMLSDYDPDEDYVVALEDWVNDFVVKEIKIDTDGHTVVLELDKDEY